MGEGAIVPSRRSRRGGCDLGPREREWTGPWELTELPGRSRGRSRQRIRRRYKKHVTTNLY